MKSRVETVPPGWLHQLPRQLAAELMSHATERNFDDGEVVSALGVDQRSIWCVKSGRGRALISMREQELRLAHILGPGFWFGEYAIITDRERLVEVEASGATTLLQISKPAIAGLLTAKPEFWKGIALLAMLNQALAIWSADDLMLRSSDSRLAAVLLRLSGHRAATQGTEPHGLIPASQREISVAANISRSTLAKLLGGFAESGAVETGYNAVRVLDKRPLEAVLDT